MAGKPRVFGYMPDDTPPLGALLSLGFQQVLTMFPATVLVAILTKFDVGVTILTSGLGTLVALLVSKRRIPMHYGSSFSPFPIPVVFPNGIPAIVFSAIAGILLNLLFVTVKPEWLGVKERASID